MKRALKCALALLAAIVSMHPHNSYCANAVAGSAAAAVPPHVAAWITIPAGHAFTFSAPRETERTQLPGAVYDSFVQGYKNPKFTMDFDYGYWSNSLQDFLHDPAYKVEYMTVDGRKARVVTGFGGEASPWGCKDTVTAMYLVERQIRDNHVALEMDACTADPSEIPTLHKMFASVRFLPKYSKPFEFNSLHYFILILPFLTAGLFAASSSRRRYLRDAPTMTAFLGLSVIWIGVIVWLQMPHRLLDEPSLPPWAFAPIYSGLAAWTIGAIVLMTRTTRARIFAGVYVVCSALSAPLAWLVALSVAR